MNTCKFLFAVLSATGGSAFNHGFNAGFVNTVYLTIIVWYAQIRAKRKLDLAGFYNTAVMGPFLIASFALGGIVGSLLIWVTATCIGRRMTLIVCNGIVILGLIIVAFSYLAKSYEVLIVGRVILGVAAGLSSGITPMYVVEISPACVRGAAGSFYYVMMALAIATANILGVPSIMGGETYWPWLFLMGIVPALIQIICMVLCPESPRHLYIDKKDEESAEEALLWFNDNGDIEEDLEDLREEDEVLEEIGPPTFSDIFVKQIFRSPMLITSVFMLGQRMCGADVVIYCSVELFDAYGYTIKQQVDFTIGIGICNLISAIVSMILMDRLGRKLLFFISLGGVIVSILGATSMFLLLWFEGVPPSLIHGAVFFLYLYVITYALGVGTIPWFYSAELCNHLARPATMTISVTMNWLMSFVLLITFLILRTVLKQFVFLFYLIFALFTIIFGILTMRETNSMMLVDVAELFYD